MEPESVSTRYFLKMSPNRPEDDVKSKRLGHKSFWKFSADRRGPGHFPKSAGRSLGAGAARVAAETVAEATGAGGGGDGRRENSAA